VKNTPLPQKGIIMNTIINIYETVVTSVIYQIPVAAASIGYVVWAIFVRPIGKLSK